MSETRRGTYGAALPARVWSRYVCETVGTALFTGIGFGGVALASLYAPGEPLVLSLVAGLSFGLGLALMVYVFGPRSDAHFNPAVSLVMALDAKLSWRDFGAYVVAQLVGATAAAMAVAWMLPGATAAMYAPALGETVGLWHGAMLEATGAFVLLIVIAAVTGDDRVAGPLNAVAVGSALGVSVAVAATFTGGAFNPARALGPMLAGLSVQPVQLLVAYVLAPALGMVAAYVLNDLILQPAVAPSDS